MDDLKEGRGYGHVLVDKGLITRDQLEESFKFQQARGGKLKDILIRLGYATNEEMHSFISSHLDIPYVKLTLDIVDPEAARLIPAKVARAEQSEHTPILMMSAIYRKGNYYHAAIEAGADEYMVKPFEPEELLQNIKRLLAGTAPD